MIKMTIPDKTDGAYLELGWNGDFFYASIKRGTTNEVIASLTGTTPQELSDNLVNVGWEPLNSMVLAALKMDKKGAWK